jgi:transcriptional regulator with XRE-family HTH domain
MKKSLGEKLRSLRGGRSQAEMAGVFGVSQSAYSAWERDAKEPSLSTVGAICQTFDVSADWLLGLSSGSCGGRSRPQPPPAPDAASAPASSDWRDLAISQQETIAELTRLLSASQKGTAPARTGGRTATKTA